MAEFCAGIKFMDEEHKRLFTAEPSESAENFDVYHMALIYCLGIDRTVREHFEKVYDLKNGADPDRSPAGGMADLGKQACNQTGIQSVYQRYSQCR